MILRPTDQSARRGCCPARKKPQQSSAKTQLTSGSFARQFLRVIFARFPRQITRATFRNARSCIVLRRSGTDWQCEQRDHLVGIEVTLPARIRYITRPRASEFSHPRSGPLQCARSVRVKVNLRISQVNLALFFILNLQEIKKLAEEAEKEFSQKTRLVIKSCLI